MPETPLAHGGRQLIIARAGANGVPLPPHLSQEIARTLIAEGHSVEAVVTVLQALMGVVLQKNEKGEAEPEKSPRKKGGTEKPENPLTAHETGQAIVLGQPEVDS